MSSLDPNTRKVYIYTQGTFTSLCTSTPRKPILQGPRGSATTSRRGADYYTEIVCQRNKVEYVLRYKSELEAVRKLVAVIGEEECCYLSSYAQRW